MEINMKNMIDYDEYLSEFEDKVYSSVVKRYANFVFAYVLEGKYVETEEHVDVLVTQSEFDKLTKAKQNKLLVEWELQAYKQFTKYLFDNANVLSMPTDLVDCTFMCISA